MHTGAMKAESMLRDVTLHASRAVRARLACVSGLFVCLLAACSPQSQDKSTALSFNATDITGASFAKTLSLNDAATKSPRTLESYKGKVTVFFFGYLFCPDYCPTTMTTLNSVLATMSPEDAKQVEVVFVTVDPKRDTPEQLATYVAAFNPSFKALYGSQEATDAVKKEWKIIAQKAQVKDENTYLVDHSTQMYVFDKANRIRLMIRHEAGAAAIAKDLTTLVRS